MVVGGVASVLYGVPRVTFDLDILIEPTAENAQRLLAALIEVGFGTATMTDAQDIIAHEITVFDDRVRIDVLTCTPGVSFQDAWRRRKTITYQGQDFFILSKEDLVAAKRASGREVDLDDIRLLELPGQEDTTS
jgi:hypothetical protein